MQILVVKDATLTVKAGQLVEVDDKQAALAIRMGFAKEEKKAPRGKKSEGK